MHVLDARKGEVKAADGTCSAYLDKRMSVSLHGELYSNTVRSSSCELLTNGQKCQACVKYRSTWRAMHVRWQKRSSPSERSAISSVEEEMDADLRRIMDDYDANICSASAPQSFQCLFWKQQREAMGKSNPRQIRWHPMMIKWCLHVHMLSSASYNSIRSTGVLKLPSDRTLRDYSNVVKANLM